MAIPISQLPSDLVYNGQLDISNPDKQTKYNQLNAQWQAGQGGGGTPSSVSSGGFTSLNPQDTIQAAIKALQEANKPAVESLQASIPETQAKYATEKTRLTSSQPSLEARYQGLLDQIKGNQETDVNAQTNITASEMGKRGLTGSSTLAQQEIQNAVSPLNTRYAGLSTQTGLAREDAIKALQDTITGLVPQETSDLGAIRQAIANLSSGAGTQGVSTGLNLYSANLGAKSAADTAKAEADQRAITNAIAQAQLANETAQTKYNIGKSYSSGGADDTTSLINQINGIKTGNTGTKLTPPPMSAPSGTTTEYPKGSGIYWTSTGNGWS